MKAEIKIEMEKTYHPESIEKHWYALWEKEDAFSPKGNDQPYCIMLPPPNVTGSLHMGHGFGFTLIDILIRYHRMQGDNTLWQTGTDHAALQRKWSLNVSSCSLVNPAMI